MPLAAAPAAAALILSAGPAAAAARDMSKAIGTLGHAEVGSVVVSLGLLLVTLTTGFVLAHLRSRAARTEAALRTELGELRLRLARAETLLSAEPQVIVTFGGARDEPEIEGDLGADVALPPGRRVLAFGLWLAPAAAAAAERAVDSLRSRGQAFALTVPTKTGRHIEIEGRPVGGRTLLRLRDVTGDRLALAEMTEERAHLAATLEQFRLLLQALPYPAWLRGAGRLAWVNPAFATAVEAPDPVTAAEDGLELLDADRRAEMRARAATGEIFRRRLPAIVAGQRRIFDVIEAPSPSGAAGLAVDVSELEETRIELRRRTEAHRRTLDELATAVAIFRADGVLVFYNHAYQQLWNLEPAFLEQEPTESAVLDRLRARRLLPEQTDFRSWKEQFLDAYRAIEAREHWWHLPDGRTLRVVQSPNPEGGVTCLFDDVSERLDLESRYNALIRVQTETLDHLREGVAVFGSDGRLRLFNPALVRMWKLAPDELALRPHVERVFALCRVLHDHEEPWAALKQAVTALPEGRTTAGARMTRPDGSVVDAATVPLPEGATLVAFSDVTASVAMERALTERNEALEAAARIKTAFVKHVSYELRSPLTTIIGFTQLLGDVATGPLNEKQREYVGYVVGSSAALLAIINDILDLATIDAGAMELDLGEVDVRKAMEAAAEGVRDRLAEADLRLVLKSPAGVGSFVADEKRVRQVLFNLLANAVAFSPAGGVVTLAAERRSDAVVFHVGDQGPGIPAEMIERVFDRFETGSPAAAHHRGVGLGLSIVRSFVALHGGTVDVDSIVDVGTTVAVAFPLHGSAARIAAE
jgi:signal transduction histidine kinase